MAAPRPATAAEAFGITVRALKIKPRWLQQILEGTKRIEIRKKPCPHKGWISLAATGVLEIQGRALISGSHRLSAAEREEYAGTLEALAYEDPWAWEIEEVELLPSPIAIPSWVARGSVQWLTRERWQRWDDALLRSANSSEMRVRPKE
ncbi:unnamed protein product, partial [Symbiodinium natans]